VSTAIDMIGHLKRRSAELEKALRGLFEASKRHDPDGWDGEQAMIEAAQVLREPPFDKGES